jgi:uncharacterized short protein YbdD (DUF466 family)
MSDEERELELSFDLLFGLADYDKNHDPHPGTHPAGERVVQLKMRRRGRGNKPPRIMAARPPA